MNVLRIGLAVAAAAGWLAMAAPASAQFYFKSKDLTGPRATGTEPGIVGQDLAGATPEELRAAMVWNIRAALNVAALQCQFAPTLQTLRNYNALVEDHEAELKASFDTLTKYFRRTSKTAKEGQTKLDQYGTRVYSGYSTVSAQRIFCQTAGRIAEDAAFVPRGQLHELAATRLREMRNALVPWGEQAFPAAGYGYLLTSAPNNWPDFRNEKCWRDSVWQVRRCGETYYRATTGVAVANR